MLLPVGQSILARAAGPQRMGRVMSIIGVPMVLGPILGPVIGGLIVSNFSWRWIFYINLPIGIVTLILSSRWLPKWDTDERFPTTFDTLGFCLLSPGLAALVYSLAEVGTTGSFTSTSVLVSFVLGLVLMVGVHLPRAAHQEPAARAAPVQGPQLHHRQHLHLHAGLHPVRLHVPAAALLPDRPRAGGLGRRAADGPPGHRRRLHHALGRQHDGPGRAAAHRAVRHLVDGGRDDPLRVRHLLDQRGAAGRARSSCAASVSD